MINVSPKEIFKALLGVIAILLLANIAGYMYLIYYNTGTEAYFFKKTNFNSEKNLPSIFSSSLHFIAAILLAIIGSGKLKIRKNKPFWWFLGFLLLFTGLDELLRIHEKVGQFFSASFETTGFFFFSWVIPYGIAAIILGFLLLKPLLSLPKRTALNFITAGIIFLSGAVGIEMFTGWYITSYELDLRKLLVLPEIFIFSTLEELLEMIGMSYFIYSLLKFITLYKVESPSKKQLKWAQIYIFAKNKMNERFTGKN